MSERQQVVIDTSTLIGAVLRPKFYRYVPLQERLGFCALVSERARLWDVDTTSEQVADGACRDVKDAKFLALALACQAVALVSSDADLPILHPWNGVPILTPAAFLTTMKLHLFCLLLLFFVAACGYGTGAGGLFLINTAARGRFI